MLCRTELAENPVVSRTQLCSETQALAKPISDLGCQDWRRPGSVALGSSFLLSKAVSLALMRSFLPEQGEGSHILGHSQHGGNTLGADSNSEVSGRPPF